MLLWEISKTSTKDINGLCTSYFALLFGYAKAVFEVGIAFAHNWPKIIIYWWFRGVLSCKKKKFKRCANEWNMDLLLHSVVKSDSEGPKSDQKRNSRLERLLCPYFGMPKVQYWATILKREESSIANTIKALLVCLKEKRPEIKKKKYSYTKTPCYKSIVPMA